MRFLAVRLPIIRSFSAWCAVAVFLYSGQADARRFRVGHIPNGDASGCLTCHAPGPQRIRNAFGSAVESTLGFPKNEASVDWSLFFSQDSDGDGYTNGQELSDPDGLWMPGLANPEFLGANPGNSLLTPCGNGVAQFHEECDRDDLRGDSCQSRGVEGPGELTCTSDCLFDEFTCTQLPPVDMPDPTEADMGSDSTDLGADRIDSVMTLDMNAFEVQLIDDSKVADEGCDVVSFKRTLPLLYFVLMLVAAGLVRRSTKRSRSAA
jgi:hypothetical protein